MSDQSRMTGEAFPDSVQAYGPGCVPARQRTADTDGMSSAPHGRRRRALRVALMSLAAAAHVAALLLCALIPARVGLSGALGSVGILSWTIVCVAILASAVSLVATAGYVLPAVSAWLRQGVAGSLLVWFATGLGLIVLTTAIPLLVCGAVLFAFVAVHTLTGTGGLVMATAWFFTEVWRARRRLQVARQSARKTLSRAARMVADRLGA